MQDNGSNNKGEEDILNFVLLIRQITRPEGIAYTIQIANQGIANAQIILMVEAWLDKVRQQFKDGVTHGMDLGDGK